MTTDRFREVRADELADTEIRADNCLLHPSSFLNATEGASVRRTPPHGEQPSGLDTLWARYKKFRALEDRDQLVLAYEYLVNRLRPKHEAAESGWFDKDDYLQVGTLGLCEAIERFDPDEGVPFERFAAKRISWAMTDSARSSVDWASRRTRDQLNAITATRESFTAAHHREPTPTEIADCTDLAQQTVTDLVVLAQNMESGHSDVVEHGWMLAAEQPNDHDWRQEIRALPEKEKMVVVLHFLEGLALSDVAFATGISLRTAHVYKDRAIKRMRESLLHAA